MHWFTKSALIGTIAVAALLAGYLFYAWVDVSGEKTPDAGAALFAATLTDVHGQQQALSQWKGKVVIVNFWATWCPPCLKEIPELVRVQERMAPQGVQILGIAIDTPDHVKAFAGSVRMNYPILVAELEGLTLARQAGNRLGGLPFTVVLDRQGRTAHVHLGGIDEQRLGPILKPLL